MGVPREGEANKVFWGEVKSAFGHNGIHPSEKLRKTVYFTSVPMGKIRSKVF